MSEDESQRSREPRWADLLQRHQDSLLRPLHLQGLRREDLVGKMPPVEGTTASGVERTNSLLNMEVRNKGTSSMRVKPRDNFQTIVNKKDTRAYIADATQVVFRIFVNMMKFLYCEMTDKIKVSNLHLLFFSVLILIQ